MRIGLLRSPRNIWPKRVNMIDILTLCALAILCIQVHRHRSRMTAPLPRGSRYPQLCRLLRAKNHGGVRRTADLPDGPVKGGDAVSRALHGRASNHTGPSAAQRLEALDFQKT